MPSLVFYSNPYSTYCTRVRFFLEEAGRAYSTKDIDLGGGEQHSARYREQYPLQQVPSIAYGDFRLGESNAIMRYLAQRWQCFDLYPATLEDRAEVEQWQDFATGHICNYIGDLAWYRYWAAQFGAPRLPAIEAHAEKFLLYYMPMLETRLSNRQVLCGTSVSIADISLLPFLDIYEKTGLSLRAFPAVHAYAQRLMSSAAWQRTKALIK